MQTRVAVIDADGHIMESDAQIYEYLPPPYRGNSGVLTQGSFFPSIDGWNRSARRIADGQNRVPENPTAQDWLQYLDSADIICTVLYPSLGLGYGLVKDPHWAAALGRAYNDFLYDCYLRVDPKRLKGAALIPLQDPDAAVVELRRAVTELGMVAAMLPATGLRDPLGHRNYWPIYRAAEELGVILTVHAGAGQGIGLDNLERLIEVRTLSHGFGQSIAMTSMMYSGVFDAFPRLRVAYAEAGCGWVPYLAERLDMEYSHRRAQAPDLKVLPSEHLRSGRIFVHCELGEAGLVSALELLGEEALFVASDYPHEPKHEFPEAITEFLQRTDIGESAKSQILAGNARRMYQF